MFLPDGLKQDELWIAVSGPTSRLLMVCDAFAADAKPDDTPLLPPKLRGAFATMLIGDRETYKMSATRILETVRPDVLLPCHGGMVCEPDLTAQLVSLVAGI